MTNKTSRIQSGVTVGMGALVMEKNRRYVIISPCRDEAKLCHFTLDSVIAQTIQPVDWIVVDGSSDHTPEILEAYAQQHDFIKVIHEREGGHRRIGPGVVEAFNKGLASINLDDYDYICKLDMDVELPPAYFENLMERMEANPRLGTCSGKPYFLNPTTGQLISEKSSDAISVGMVKFYRVACFQDIGGFINQLGWTTIDCLHCRMRGWQARSWNDPEIRFTEHRMAGGSHRGILTGRMREGYARYISGTLPAYFFATAVFRMTRPPTLIGGLAMIWGYMMGALKRSKRYDDPETLRVMHWYEWNSLLKGRHRATELLEERYAAVRADALHTDG